MQSTNAGSIVEVSVDSAFGRRAVGIMSMRQALDLPDWTRFSYTHPDPAMAAEGIVVSRQELERFVPR